MQFSSMVEPLPVLITNDVISFAEMKTWFLLFVGTQCNVSVNVDAAVCMSQECVQLLLGETLFLWCFLRV